jgi:Ca2+-binding RTX toxin-like protein
MLNAIRKLFRTSTRRRPRPAAGARLSVEALDSRILLSASHATFTATLAGDTLTITALATYRPVAGQSVLVNDGPHLTITDRHGTLTVTDGETYFGVRDEGVRRIEFHGSAANDTLVNNTSLPLTAWGNAGNDHFVGGSGDDSLYGGAGNDILEGGAGNDLLDGGVGDDIYAFNPDTARGHATLVDQWGAPGAVAGTPSRATVHDPVADQLGDTSDTLNFSAGKTTGVTVDLGAGGSQRVTANFSLTLTGHFEQVLGSQAADVIIGNELNNTLQGGGGDDYISGKGGDDMLIGGTGNDTLYGDAGNDTLYGGAGNDWLQGAVGNDTYVFNTDAAQGRDTLVERSGEGTDTLDFSAGKTVGIHLDLAHPTVQLVNSNLTLQLGMPGWTMTPQIENVQGSQAADSIWGNELANTFWGNGGNDVLNGKSGSDVLYGGDGQDVFFASGRATAHCAGGESATGPLVVRASDPTVTPPAQSTAPETYYYDGAYWSNQASKAVSAVADNLNWGGLVIGLFS